VAIIVLSASTCSGGRYIAEQLAERLGYVVFSHEDVIDDLVSGNGSADEVRQALQYAPSFFERLTYDKERQLARFRTAFLQRLQRDNVIYHGIAGHFLTKGLSGMLKVRIVGDIKIRVQCEMNRDGISESEAYRSIIERDQVRRKWSRALYGVDSNDPTLCDVMIHIKQFSVDDAIDMISRMVTMKQFALTSRSLAKLRDTILAAAVKEVLSDDAPRVAVTARNGVVAVRVPATGFNDDILVEAVNELARTVPGVVNVKIELAPVVPFGSS
jgi:cytidylate kinase